MFSYINPSYAHHWPPFLPEAVCILTSVGNIIVMRGGLDGFQRTTYVEFLGNVVKVMDSGMSTVISTIDQSSFLRLVGSVDILNSQDSQRHVITRIQQGNTLGGLNLAFFNLLLADIESYGDGPQQSIGKTHVLNNTVRNGLIYGHSSVCIGCMYVLMNLPFIILLVQEAFEGRETTV